jgi:DNA-directed RNA polymerase subunit A'
MAAQVPQAELAKVIKRIKFGVLPPSEIRKYSVVEIFVPETYDEDGFPVKGGLMDPRLGTLEPGQKCETCGNTSARCPGHFGHIELAEPVVHVNFVDDIYTLLSVTCRVCGRILLPEAEIRYYKELVKSKGFDVPGLREALSREIAAKARKSKVCPHCGREQAIIDLQKPYYFQEKVEGGAYVRLLPSAIRERFERIPNEDLELLGYDPSAMRPEWLILQALPVAPLSVRPSITLETGIRSEDDLTHKLVDILRTNARIREAKAAGSPPLIMQDLIDLLQYHVATYFNNEISGIPPAHHRSGRPLRTLSQRLKGKEGRFRGSLSGKRVDFSARTVISPDPSLDIAEVGVPYEVAMRLTVPEYVNEWNLEEMRKLVINGPSVHPGANYIIRPDGVKIRLDFVADRQALAQSLAPGYVVERHLRDGDVVLFNRQPSLHRMSIMAHQVRVLPYRTFRLNPAVCPPYNADFDGDEMNLHASQSLEARSEEAMLMRVQDQILSPRFGGPIIGITKDLITSAYLLTRDDLFLTKEEFANFAWMGGYEGPLPPPAIEAPEPLYTGKQLLSLFLPPGFSYVLASKWGRALKIKDGGDVVVKDGHLVSGVLDKNALGAEAPDSLLHRIVKDYGPEQARRFLNALIAILRVFLTRYGFSYGYSDLDIGKEALKEIEGVLSRHYAKVDELLEKYRKGTLEVSRGLTPEEALEEYIVDELTRARDDAGRIAERYLTLENPGVIMARTGARGSLLNLTQMASCLGQQTVRGKRISRGYRGRSLPHFPLNDPTPDANGFIKNSYRSGLTPTEFFFHAMGGREGLIDTAVRTQQSGYMQRRLIHTLEHLRVEYDSTVRDPLGNIIQFVYGEDGIDPAKSDHGKPVNVQRLVETIKLKDKGEPLEPKAVEQLLARYKGAFTASLIEGIKEAVARTPLSREGMEQLLERIEELVERSKVEPGEAVGVVAAQSIGEPGTQMTLRTFHYAGVREMNVTLGLPRLIELVDARKIPSTPRMKIYLDEEHRRDAEKALRLANQLVFTRVAHVVSSVSYDPEAGALLLSLNVEAMKEKGVTLEDVARVVGGSKRKAEPLDEATIRVEVGALGPQELYNVKQKILHSKLRGVPDITGVTVTRKKKSEDPMLIEDEEWVIETSGSNLAQVLRVPGVDPSRVLTNSIYEVYTVLGIEAAREALVREIMGTLEEQGLEVDRRHILLVADLLTAKGLVQPAGRHGVVGSKASVLARAAFEITIPVLSEAAVRGEVEELKGVTENVIVGHIIPVGTGMVNIMMDLGGLLGGKGAAEAS